MTLDLDTLRARANAGQGKARIGRDLGVSPSSVYRAAKRHGITLSSGPGYSLPVSLREAVQDMRLREALEFALAAYEAAVGQDEKGTALAASLGLLGRQAQIFCLLHRRAGQIVTHERILGVCSAISGPDRPMSRNSVGVQILHLRRKLAGQFTITTAYGLGYILEPT